MTEAITTGEWCYNCKFFETEVELNEEGNCVSCGCSIKEHGKATLVKSPEADEPAQVPIPDEELESIAYVERMRDRAEGKS